MLRGNIVVRASNMKDALSESKDGEGVTDVELPPNADDEIDIQLEPSILLEHGQTHYNILISNI
jgi:3-dehydroquinate synthase class II